jgi:hypothetical protein
MIGNNLLIQIWKAALTFPHFMYQPNDYIIEQLYKQKPQSAYAD